MNIRVCMKTDSSYGQVLNLPDRKILGAQDITPRHAPILTDMLGVKPADPATTGFLLSVLPDTNGPILWVQDHASRRQNGHLYTPCITTHTILMVSVNHPRDVLWAMEEGATCAGLSAVVGEIHGAPAVLSFTATKRLAMRADISGVPVFLLRSGDPGVLSAARMRWRVTSMPSRIHPHDSQSPGNPQWDVDLFRARDRAPGRWVARYDPNSARAADRLSLVPRPDNGTLDTGDKPVSNRASS